MSCLYLISTILYLSLACVYADEVDNPHPPKMGNFALEGSQQLSPLFSFGNSILDKGLFQLGTFADFFVGNERYVSDLNLDILYGVTNRLTLHLVGPYAPVFESGGSRSSGLEDIYLQGEYAFYVGESKRSTKQASIIGAVFAPTGSAYKNPNTGNGAMSYLVGFAYNQMLINYFLFTSQGLLVPTSHHHTQNGLSYLYQFGIARNFAYEPKKWIFAGLLEINGQWFSENVFLGIKQNNSGGNVIFVTPSLFFSTPHWIVQLGVGAPLWQDWNGQQNNFNYQWAANISYTFDKKAKAK